MYETHDIAQVPVLGDVSACAATSLRRTLDELISGGTRRIVLNMQDVPYIDSDGLGVLFGCVRSMRERGGLLSLVNVKPEVMRRLSTVRLVDYCPVSAAGSAPEVVELDPGTLPLWKTTLPVDPADQQAARARITHLAERLDFNPDTVFDITLAAGEAMGNACDHTAGDGVLATVSAYPDRLIVEVSDSGDGFEPDQLACVRCGEADERGRGIRLMRLLVDSVMICRRTPGPGMVVRLTKLV